jgi:outer membrane protein assembly factor BamB
VALDMSTAVINRELLFGFSHFKSGQLFCLDPKSGEVLWQSPGRTGQNVAFLALPGHVVALVNDGRLRIIPAVRERYEQVASYQVAERETWAPPVFLKNALLVKGLKTLTLWSLQDAKDGAASVR